MLVFLDRYETGDQGTRGLLAAYDNGAEFTCHTLELPWRDNAPSISCIPPGEYDCVFNWSNGLKRLCYLLQDVPDRAGVRIHSGNFGGDKAKGFKTHIQGCILLGKDTGRMAGQVAVLQSVIAVREFEEFMRKEPFTLVIGGDFHVGSN